MNIENKAPFSWLVVGAGHIARKVMREGMKNGKHRVAAIYNRTLANGEAFSAEFGGEAADNLSIALKTPGIEGAYIATTNDNHLESALKCLEAGIPVLCEKPVCVNLKQTKQLIDAARKNGVYFAEAMWTWFSPVAHRVLDWVQNRAIGEIKEARFSYAMPGEIFLPRLTNPAQAGGTLLDIGIYPITYAYRLFGMPEELVCSGTLRGGVDICETVNLRYGGFSVRCKISMVNDVPEDDACLKGSSGEIFIPNFYRTPKAVLVQNGDRLIFESKDYSYENELNLAAKEIRAGKKESEFVPHSATADVMSLLDECRKQLGLRYPME
jgi:predicted dehydrogenase